MGNLTYLLDSVQQRDRLARSIDGLMRMAQQMTHVVSIDLRGVVYREGPWYIAHCLELDLPAEGRTPQDAVKAAVELCNHQVVTALKDGDLRSIFRPAPSEIWELYFKASAMHRQPRMPRGPLNDIQFRELAIA